MSRLTEWRKQAIIGRAWWLRPHSLILQFGCAAMLAATGCTTMQSVDRNPGAAQGIESGESVVVSTHDGRELQLLFADWTSEGLTGTDETGILQKIENEDIARVDVERISALRSLGVVGVVLAVVLATAEHTSDFGYHGSL